MYGISLIYDSFLRNCQLSIFNFQFGDHIDDFLSVFIQKIHKKPINCFFLKPSESN